MLYLLENGWIKRYLWTGTNHTTREINVQGSTIMQLQSSHNIKLEWEAFKSVDSVALTINENLLPHILDINLLFLSIIIKTTHVGTITLWPVLVYCWRGYTVLAPWCAMFLFSPCITDVWTNADIFMWHPVCCCNVIIFLDILCCMLINKTYYLVTEKNAKADKALTWWW
jgi:hypothetical protein